MVLILTKISDEILKNFDRFICHIGVDSRFNINIKNMTDSLTIPQFDVNYPMPNYSKEITQYLALDCEMVSCFNRNDRPCS